MSVLQLFENFKSLLHQLITHTPTRSMLVFLLIAENFFQLALKLFGENVYPVGNFWTKECGAKGVVTLL